MRHLKLLGITATVAMGTIAWGLGTPGLAAAQGGPDAGCGIPDLLPYEARGTYEIPNGHCVIDAGAWPYYRNACVNAYREHRRYCDDWCGSCGSASLGSATVWSPEWLMDPQKAQCVEKWQPHGQPKNTAIYVCRVSGGCDCR